MFKPTLSLFLVLQCLFCQLSWSADPITVTLGLYTVERDTQGQIVFVLTPDNQLHPGKNAHIQAYVPVQYAAYTWSIVGPQFPDSTVDSPHTGGAGTHLLGGFSEPGSVAESIDSAPSWKSGEYTYTVKIWARNDFTELMASGNISVNVLPADASAEAPTLLSVEVDKARLKTTVAPSDRGSFRALFSSAQLVATDIPQEFSLAGVRQELARVKVKRSGLVTVSLTRASIELSSFGVLDSTPLGTVISVPYSIKLSGGPGRLFLVQGTVQFQLKVRRGVINGEEYFPPSPQF